MYFNKINIPANFRFLPSVESQLIVKNLGSDVFQLCSNNSRWTGTDSQAELDKGLFSETPSRAEAHLDDNGFSLSYKGRDCLKSLPGWAFGVSREKWMMLFRYEESMRFYGQGEKFNGLEKSFKKTKFWNTDVWADFSHLAMQKGHYDPGYVSIPYLLIKQPDYALGILINNPYPVFMDTASTQVVEGQLATDSKRNFYIGSTDGTPEIFFIYGKNVAEVTAKLQKLSGTVPRPPLWALGNQQCRWGYKSWEDIEEIERKYREKEIPVDGIWLDIDYMRGYRVFTFNEERFPDEENHLKEFDRKGHKIVPILDPGVKREKGFPVYDDGRKNDVFCKNSEGGEYVGYVWPGETVFPDFSLKRVRKWWAEKVEKFAKKGISGVWLDMNDPSTGPSELDEMLFNNGTKRHESYHNQYALGMQKASFEGFKAANPKDRTFILSRSGFISSSRYAALWTGDNYSNEDHLKQTVPVTLNLGLSGNPFNGPDVSGFGGDTTGPLMRTWYKAGFLFPFFRNHTEWESRFQEPWAFGESVERVVARFIRLRYKFLPYLYQQFVIQEEQGHPILRPVFYDYPDSGFDYREDQFLVGKDILQAPLLTVSDNRRMVHLPEGRWYGAHNGEWTSGGNIIETEQKEFTTPLYFREGAIIPLQKGMRTSSRNRLDDIELHLFFSGQGHFSEKSEYCFDDGTTTEYREGIENRYTIQVDSSDDDFKIRIDTVSENIKPLSFSVHLYCPVESVSLYLNGEYSQIRLEENVTDLIDPQTVCRTSSSFHMEQPD